jgi:hypothetical protein
MKILTIDTEKLRGALWGKQPAIAPKLGIHHNTLSRKLNSDRGFRLDELNKIAVALGRNTMEFLKEVDAADKSVLGGE